jgi:hypothetical protein
VTDWYRTQVIGFGPAALGIFLAADRKGHLARLLGQGCLVLERERTRERARDARFPYKIRSNSRGRDFLLGYERATSFSTVLATDAARSVADAAEAAVELSTVGELMNSTADLVEGMLERAPQSLVRYGVRVHALLQLTNGDFRTLADDGSTIAESAQVIVATGAQEDPTPILSATGTDPNMVVPSATILRGDLGAVHAAVDAGSNVHVIGSSHSAFSALGIILQRLGAVLRPGQLTLVHREVPLYFQSIAEAVSENYPLSLANISPITGEVNKFDGLRGEPRSLYLDLVRGRETRAILQRWEDFRGRARRSLYVSAVGYSPRFINVMLAPTSDECVCRLSQLRVDDACRILNAEDRPIRGLFGIGIGFAPQTESGQKRIGLNYFHGVDADAIVSNLNLQSVVHDHTQTSMDQLSELDWSNA